MTKSYILGMIVNLTTKSCECGIETSHASLRKSCMAVISVALEGMSLEMKTVLSTVIKLVSYLSVKLSFIP